MDNIIDENERWLDETGGDRSKLKMFHNCEFKPISIKPKKENEEIIKTFPPYHKLDFIARNQESTIILPVCEIYH